MKDNNNPFNTPPYSSHNSFNTPYIYPNLDNTPISLFQSDSHPCISLSDSFSDIGALFSNSLPSKNPEIYPPNNIKTNVFHPQTNFSYNPNFSSPSVINPNNPTPILTPLNIFSSLNSSNNYPPQHPASQEEFIIHSKFRNLDSTKRKYAAPSNTQSLEEITLNTPTKKAPPQKIELIKLLEQILSMKITYKVLTDIEFSDGTTKFTVLGREKVSGSSTNQMCHITPHAFVKNLIESAIKNSQYPQAILESFARIFKMLLKNKEGYCFSQETLKNYSDNLQTRVKIKANKVVTSKNQSSYIISPKKLKTDKNSSFSPTKAGFTSEKKEQAQKEFSQQYPRFLEEALVKLANLVKDDQNTANMTAEILARFIFKIFNTQESVAFPKEGNTQNFEIRLYASKEDAQKASEPKSKIPYEVISTKKLAELKKEKGVESFSEKIRIVDCEGANTTKIIKSLEALNEVIRSDLLINTDIKDKIEFYNQIKPIKLVLANSEEDISEYHQTLTSKNYAEKICYHIARLVYIAFDFKALEEVVLVENDEGDISLYNRASSEVLTEYSLKPGAFYRQNQINRADGKYNKDVKFREEKTNLKFLVEKLVDHFIMSTMAYSYLIEKDNLLSSSLNSLLKLTSIDYKLKENEENELVKDGENYYSDLMKNNYISESSNTEITLVGQDFFNNSSDSNLILMDN
jgi:hypothetical protein